MNILHTRNAPAGERAKRHRAGQAAIGYAMIGPSLLALLLFAYYPFFSGLYHSFTDWNGLTTTFVGFANYRDVLSSTDWWRSLANAGVILAGSAVKTLTLPLIAAELLFAVRSVRRRSLYRALIMVSLGIPWMVNILIWSSFYHPRTGLLNNLIVVLGLPVKPPIWLGSRGMALLSILLVGFPWVSGIPTLVFLAGLQGIPEEILDAAKVDGVKGIFRRLWHFDLPLIAGQVKMLLVLVTIGALQGYEIVFVLTGGGPARETLVPGLLMYQNAFLYQRYGSGCAIAVLVMLLILGATLLNQRSLRPGTVLEPSAGR